MAEKIMLIDKWRTRITTGEEGQEGGREVGGTEWSVRGSKCIRDSREDRQSSAAVY